jgi:hypothetical protein
VYKILVFVQFFKCHKLRDQRCNKVYIHCHYFTPEKTMKTNWNLKTIMKGLEIFMLGIFISMLGSTISFGQSSKQRNIKPGNSSGIHSAKNGTTKSGEEQPKPMTFGFGTYSNLKGSTNRTVVNMDLAKLEDDVYLGKVSETMSIPLEPYKRFEPWMTEQSSDFTGKYQFFNASIEEMHEMGFCKKGGTMTLELKEQTRGSYDIKWMIKRLVNDGRRSYFLWNFETGEEELFYVGPEERILKDPKTLDKYTLEKEEVSGKISLIGSKGKRIYIQFVQYPMPDKILKGLILRVDIKGKSPLVLFMQKMG